MAASVLWVLSSGVGDGNRLETDNNGARLWTGSAPLTELNTLQYLQSQNLYLHALSVV